MTSNSSDAATLRPAQQLSSSTPAHRPTPASISGLAPSSFQHSALIKASRLGALPGEAFSSSPKSLARVSERLAAGLPSLSSLALSPVTPRNNPWMRNFHNFLPTVLASLRAGPIETPSLPNFDIDPSCPLALCSPYPEPHTTYAPLFAIVSAPGCRAGLWSTSCCSHSRAPPRTPGCTRQSPSKADAKCPSRARLKRVWPK